MVEVVGPSNPSLFTQISQMRSIVNFLFKDFPVFFPKTINYYNKISGCRNSAQFFTALLL